VVARPQRRPAGAPLGFACGVVNGGTAWRRLHSAGKSNRLGREAAGERAGERRPASAREKVNRGIDREM
jgi:hypothetical protein